MEVEKGVASRASYPLDSPETARKLVPFIFIQCIRQKDALGSLLRCVCGFLRVGEITAPSDSASVHLSVADIAIDNSKVPAVVSVRIKASKTDPFRKGVTLYLGKTGSSVCPVAAI